MYRAARNFRSSAVRIGAVSVITCSLYGWNRKPAITEEVVPRPGKPKPSWSSYVSPTAWYQWSTMGADDYHFQQFISRSNLTGLMMWPGLTAGLNQREEDENLTRSMIENAQGIIKNSKTMGAMEKKKIMDELSVKLTEIVYGPGVTMEQRQQQLAVYGCSPYTEEALKLIANKFKDIGIVELGAGNEQYHSCMYRIVTVLR